ncbi:MAG: hypothetical protein COB85_00935 [Bacteroidetes bacterium]|nr:MAG: hypothetical protein COB85_00935 [Bacteroidota bacterium]
MVLSTLATYAQDQRAIDSLKSIIETGKHDTSICNAYLRWGEQIYLNDPDTALVLWQKAHDIAKENLDSGPSSILEKKYLSSFGEALNNIGYIYEHLGDIEKGLEYYRRSLEILKESGDKNGVATLFNNIAHIYYHQGDIEEALEYYNMSLKILEEIGDKKSMAGSLNNIGQVHQNHGNVAEGFEYYFKSLKIREEIGDKNGEAQSLNNIGTIYYDQGDNERALEYHLKSLKIREEMGNKNMATSLYNIGDTYLNMGDVILAKEYARKSMTVAKEFGFPDDIEAPAKLLSKVYRMEGDFKNALEMYELHIQMRDSIKNEETQKAAIRQQTKYEFEKVQLVKEQEEKESARLEAEVTNRRDNLQYSVILIAILVLFGGVLSLGFVNVSERMAEGIIFFSFLILFEFLLVLADPYIENWSSGAPGIKLLFNAGIAALIFPAHAFFESRLKGRLVKSSA